MVISYQTFEPQRFHGYQKILRKLIQHLIICMCILISTKFDMLRYFQLNYIFIEHMFGRIYRIIVFVRRVNQICHALKGMWVEIFVDKYKI